MSIEVGDALTERKRQIWLNILANHQIKYECGRMERIDAIHTARRAGLTYSDIASVVGMTQSGVRMLLTRAGDA